MKKTIVAIAIAAGAFVSSSAFAAPILGLFNTGTDASNLALTGGNGVTDPHYTYTTTGSSVTGNAVTFKDPLYAANDANSRWVSTNATGGTGVNTSIYSLSFDLTGLNAATASITGKFGVDNIGAIFLNGVATGDTIPFGFPAFQSLQAFTINSGFVTGRNVLSFSVQNTGGPGGLRVDDLAGTASAVPEPATWAMLISGVGIVGGTMRRRRAGKAFRPVTA